MSCDTSLQVRAVNEKKVTCEVYCLLIDSQADRRKKALEASDLLLYRRAFVAHRLHLLLRYPARHDVLTSQTRKERVSVNAFQDAPRGGRSTGKRALSTRTRWRVSPVCL